VIIAAVGARNRKLPLNTDHKKQSRVRTQFAPGSCFSPIPFEFLINDLVVRAGKLDTKPLVSWLTRVR
jgi:hypothetical protein